MQLSASSAGTLLLTALALAAVCVAACFDRATTTASYQHHQDDTGRISTPEVRSTVDNEELQLNTRWSADVISGATPVAAAPDAYSRASEFEQTRHEAQVGANWQQSAEQQWAGGVTASHEPDYDALALSTAVSRDILDRHATVIVGADAGFDHVGRVDDPLFSRSLWTVGVAVEFSHIINPQLVAHLGWDFETRSGFQSNPYRWVPVYDGSHRPALMLHEQHPHRRVRNAMEPMVVWAPHHELFVHMGYRFYADDWGVRGHTGQLRLFHADDSDRYRTGVRLRGYTQNDARFYRERYDDVQTLRTGDPRLSRMYSLTAGGRLELRPELFDRHRPRLSLNYDATLYRYANYPVRSSMLAHSWGLNLTMEWK